MTYHKKEKRCGTFLLVGRHACGSSNQFCLVLKGGAASLETRVTRQMKPAVYCWEEIGQHVCPVDKLSPRHALHWPSRMLALYLFLSRAFSASLPLSLSLSLSFSLSLSESYVRGCVK